MKPNQQELGKLPPAAIEIEEAVLGMLLLDRRAQVHTHLLSLNSWYKYEHQLIYAAAADLIKQGIDVNILSVSETLRKNRTLNACGGPGYIARLTNKISSAEQMEYFCLILKEHEMSRLQIEFGSQVIARAYDPLMSPLDVNEFMSDRVFEISNIANLKKRTTNLELAHKLTEQIETAGKSDGVSGVPSGFWKIDTLFGGFRPALYVLAARPGMGKTALALSWARNMAIRFKRRGIFFSLEMDEVQLFQRLASMETGIAADKMKTGKFEHEDWIQFNNNLEPLLGDHLVIVDDCYHMNEIRNRAKQERLNGPVDWIIVDYLQLAGESGKSREEVVANVSRGLKMLQKNMNVPVIALAQLSRDVDKRKDGNVPNLADLRESGAIEQDADVVCFVHRPGYYDETHPHPDEAWLYVKKHRNGKLKNVPMKYIFDRTLFTNDDEVQPPKEEPKIEQKNNPDETPF